MKNLHILLTVLLLSVGCAKHQQQPSNPLESQDPDFHQYQLQTFNTFKLTGKLSVKSGKQRLSGHIHWQQEPQATRLSIKNMLGITLLSLIQQDKQVSLKIKDETYQDSSASLLLYKLTGIIIPVEQMNDWIKGQLTSASKNVIYNENGTVASTSELDWQIIYQSYQSVNQVKLPKQVTIKNPHTTIKLRIDQWQTQQL